jgi:hypothetical protein
MHASPGELSCQCAVPRLGLFPSTGVARASAGQQRGDLAGSAGCAATRRPRCRRPRHTCGSSSSAEPSVSIACGWRGRCAWEGLTQQPVGVLVAAMLQGECVGEEEDGAGGGPCVASVCELTAADSSRPGARPNW